MFAAQTASRALVIKPVTPVQLVMKAPYVTPVQLVIPAPNVESVTLVITMMTKNARLASMTAILALTTPPVTPA